MRVTTDKEGRVDLEAPIYVTDAQRKRIIDFMNTLFPTEVVVKDVVEVTRPGFKKSSQARKWSVQDFKELLKSEDNDATSKTLGRSSMSVQMRRGSFLPSYMKWLKRKGYTKLETGEDLIQEFMNELEASE